MTREQQIKEAARKRADQYDHPSKWSDTYYGFIDGAKWADQHPHWIPVEEELPPASCGVISDPVLVFIGNNKGWSGYIREGFYNHAAKEWSYMNRGRTHKVTHWMEIVPPSIRESEKGGEDERD